MSQQVTELKPFTVYFLEHRRCVVMAEDACQAEFVFNNGDEQQTQMLSWAIERVEEGDYGAT